MDVSAVTLILFVSLSHMLRCLQAAAAFQDDQKRVLDQLLGNHDPRIRPAGENGTGPVVVGVEVFLQAVTSVSEYDMDFSVQITVKQRWTDDRLKYEAKGNNQYLTLIGSDSSKLWTPDLYVHNEKDGHLHKLMAPNNYVRVYPNGDVVYSSRLSLTLLCNMQLQNFPFDSQLCSIKLGSYGYKTDEVLYRWKERDPFLWLIKYDIVGYTMGKPQTSERNFRTGDYRYLVVEIPFKRHVSYYIYHTFLPSSVLVVISWVSFWMDRRDVVARILLVLSALFAMSALAADIEASAPRVSYVKAMDIWFGVCFTFLLGVLVESAAVVDTSKSEEQPTNSHSKKESIAVDEKPSVPRAGDSPKSDSSWYQRVLARLPRRSRDIDPTARRLFPILFLVFAVLFFINHCLLYNPPDSIIPD